MRDLSPKAAPSHERPVAEHPATGSYMRIADLSRAVVNPGAHAHAFRQPRLGLPGEMTAEW